MTFSLDVLKIDPAQELEKLSKFIVEQVNVVFRRKGVIVGLSGGIDSACIAAVAVNAVGKEKVVGLVLRLIRSSFSGYRLTNWIFSSTRGSMMCR